MSVSLPNQMFSNVVLLDSERTAFRDRRRWKGSSPVEISLHGKAINCQLYLAVEDTTMGRRVKNKGTAAAAAGGEAPSGEQQQQQQQQQQQPQQQHQPPVDPPRAVIAVHPQHHAIAVAVGPELRVYDAR